MLLYQRAGQRLIREILKMKESVFVESPKRKNQMIRENQFQLLRHNRQRHYTFRPHLIQATKNMYRTDFAGIVESSREFLEGLFLLGVGMGCCIVTDSVASVEVDKAFDLLLAKKWDEANTSFGKIIDADKVSKRYSRGGGNSKDITILLFPDERVLTDRADELTAKNKFEEAEVLYKQAMALKYRSFSTTLASYYSLDSTPWPTYQYGKLLMKMQRKKEALDLLKLSSAMYVPNYEMEKIAQWLGVPKPKIIDGSDDINKYSTGIQESRNEYRNITSDVRSNPAEFASRRQAVLASIDEHIKRYPTLAPAWLVRADVSIDDDTDQAIKDLNHLLGMYPNLPEALDMRASAFEKKHDYNSALEDYDRALEALPGAEKLLLAKASLLAKMKRFDEAQHALDLALEHNPANVEVFQEKSRIWEESGNRIASLEQLQRAVLFFELKRKVQGYWGDNQNVYTELAERLVSLGRPKDALAVLDKHPNQSSPEVKKLRKKIEEGMKS